MNRSTRLASLVSWIGHPLVFVTATVAIVLATQLAPRMALAILGALVLSVIGPTAIVLILGVRSGRWHDADVSEREERRRFYPVAIPISAFGTLAAWLAGAPRYILRGSIVTLFLLVIAAIINLRFKISLHTLFAGFCTGILFRVNVAYGIGALLLTALIFWSRLLLKRHTPAETIGGLALGTLGAIIAAWMSI
ncbi:MAG: hypothetical protein ABI925_06130 [Verrucomicrobiota bacterium]